MIPHKTARHIHGYLILHTLLFYYINLIKREMN